MYIEKFVITLISGMSLLVATACSNSSVSSNESSSNQKEAIESVSSNSLDLPKEFIITEDGTTIENFNDLEDSYIGFGSDCKIYYLSKVNDNKAYYEDPSMKIRGYDNALELSWTTTSSRTFEVISFRKYEINQPSTDSEEYDEIEEEEEMGFIMFSPTLESNKIFIQSNEFSGTLCGKTIIKSTFKHDNSIVDITFYSTKDVRNLGFPNTPIQSVLAEFKGEVKEQPLFIKVFKVDNPSFKYFLTAATNYNCEAEPDDYIIDMLNRRPQYTGIIDNDGRIFLMSR